MIANTTYTVSDGELVLNLWMSARGFSSLRSLAGTSSSSLEVAKAGFPSAVT